MESSGFKQLRRRSVEVVDMLEVVPEARREACKNPMLIDVILSNLFKFIDFGSLGVCRRVSKQWHKVSLPAWLSKGPTLRLSLDLREVPGIPMHEFLLLAHNPSHSYGRYEYSGLRQYQKFAVTGGAWHPTQHHLLMKFLGDCGRTVKDLKLTMGIPDFEYCDTYEAIVLSTMTPNLVKLDANIAFEQGFLKHRTAWEPMQEVHRNLTYLKIDEFCYDYYVNRVDDLSWLSVAGWIQLLKRYPNLKSLILRAVTKVRAGVADKVLEAIGNIRQSDTKALELKRLEICLPSADDTTGRLPSLMTLFRNAQLSLETLGLSFGGDHAPVQTVAGLLACQASTLKKVEISSYSHIADLKFPELPFLHSLELCGMPIPSLDSLSRFQNLKSLVLAYPLLPGVPNRFPKVLFGTEADFILPNLSKLHFVYRRTKNTVFVDDLDLGPRQVLQLARFFPNLTDLQMRLNNRSLRGVVQGWPGLQQLTITGHGVTDEGISRIEANLPRMQDLKYLTMKHCDDRFENNVGPARITDKSLVKFLELPNLERLQVTLDAQLLLDAEILRNMEERLKTFKLTRARKLELVTETDSDSSDAD